MENFDIFISYRRKDGVYPAMLLYRDLIDSGYKVFFDFQSLRSGEFPNKIEKAIQSCTDFIVLVTKETFTERIFNEEDWMRKEIRFAIKYNKNIIPIFIETTFPDNIPEDIKSISKYNGLSQVNPNLIKETYDQLKGRFFKSVARPVLTSHERFERRKSIYNPGYGSELSRLKVQANNAYETDRKVLDELLKDGGEYVVLDMGCGYGHVTETRFKDEKYVKVIGIDISSTCIEYANKNKQSDKFKYYQLDLEDDLIDEKLLNIFSENQVDKVDLVFTSHVLHHLKNPEYPLRKIRRILKNEGYIYIRGADDYSKLAYDDGGLLNKIVDLTLSVGGVSDRLNGRKLYAWLYNTGYNQVKIKAFLRDTSNVSYDERELLYQESFAYRINYFKKRCELEPDNEQHFKAFNHMELLLLKFQSQFYKKDFWYGEFDFIATAKK